MTKAANCYGTRICLQCQKEFKPRQPSQVTCSEKCRLARKRTLDSQSRKKRHKNLWDTLEWLNCRLENTIGFKTRATPKPNEAKKTPEAREKGKPENRPAGVEKFRHVCANCGSTFRSAYKEDSYCCDQCAKESAACGIV